MFPMPGVVTPLTTIAAPVGTVPTPSVTVVWVVNGTNVFPHLFKADGRIKVAEQIPGLGGNRLEFVAQPNVESDFLCDAPVILSVPGVKPLGHVSGGVA